MKLLAWAKSDTGRKRDHNEDRFLVADDVGLYAVADGMGGHQGGETASRMALEVLRAQVETAAVDLAAAAKRIDAARRQELFRSTAPMPALLEDDTDQEHCGPRGAAAAGAAAAEADVEDSSDENTMSSATETKPALSSPPPAVTVMRAAVRSAGHAIFDKALEEPALRGMGTTLTAMLYHGGRMHVVHAGDSRGYLFRDGRLQQLTDDHSWIAEQVKLGAMTEREARESKFRHIITRSVGFERDVDVDIKGVAVEAGDCFLLCSDGMSNYVDNPELERVLASTFYRRAPEALIEIANQRGGDDNITVVVIYIANDTG